MKNVIKQILRSNKSIWSVCSSNRYVVTAAMRHAMREGRILLIEATANQVNQQGGYSGWTPAAFAEQMRDLARKEGFPVADLVLGGDHLGPLPWKSLDSATAMDKAEELVRDYVMAGFTKIHIDTSMRLMGDDEADGPALKLIAQRSARLASAVYDSYEKMLAAHPNAIRPVLVVGSEVPIPGGSLVHEENVTPTTAEDFNRSVRVFRDAYEDVKIAWDDVVAFVVQPGVEFGDDFIIPYSRENTVELCAQISNHPGLVFEGHSTDYQTAGCLSALVEDGIRILKVGPELTFAFREAIMQLSRIERITGKLYHKPAVKDFARALLDSMNTNPGNWESYYTGTQEEIEFKKLYSFSDRCRYYLNEKNVEAATNDLFLSMENMEIPLSLISLNMPKQYDKVMEGRLRPDARSLVLDRIMDVLDRYVQACS